MTRILYGVSGEGSGHSSRAREMLTHLIGAGHDVRVMSYDRGLRNLSTDFDVLPITGLHIVTRNNHVAPLRTLAHNLRAVPAGLDTLRQARELFHSHRPDAVISDFEPMSAYLARHYRIPLISLDNQHRMRFMVCPPVPDAGSAAAVTRTVIRAMVPRPSASLVTTFYFGAVTNPYTFLFPPIVRQGVRDLAPGTGPHVLVYVTQAFDSLLDTLRRFPDQPFRVYGFDRQGEDANLSFRPFSKQGFLDDLASCRGVVATAGFTLMTEALHLAKPVLAFPMQGQFEQMLNGRLLSELGYGMSAPAPTPAVLSSFMSRLTTFEAAMQAYPRADGDRGITGKLDELLARDCELLRYYHESRYGPVRGL